MSAKTEGHDAFVKMLTDYVVPKNPYSSLLKKSHKEWEQGFWNASYEWKMKLTPAEIASWAAHMNGWSEVA